jgi:hypothetical protein
MDGIVDDVDENETIPKEHLQYTVIQKADACYNTEQSELVDCQSVTPREHVVTQLMTFMFRMENHFTGAIERIFNQQW